MPINIKSEFYDVVRLHNVGFAFGAGGGEGTSSEYLARMTRNF